MRARWCVRHPCLTLVLCAFSVPLLAADAYPTVGAREIPEGLKMVWRQTKPEMTANSGCAAITLACWRRARRASGPSANASGDLLNG